MKHCFGNRLFVVKHNDLNLTPYKLRSLEVKFGSIYGVKRSSIMEQIVPPTKSVMLKTHYNTHHRIEP